MGRMSLLNDLNFALLSLYMYNTWCFQMQEAVFHLWGRLMDGVRCILRL